MRHFAVGWTPPPGPAGLPWVPSTPTLNWVPCGSSCVSLDPGLFPLKSGSCPVVVWGLCLESQFGIEVDAVALGVGFPTRSRGHRWLQPRQWTLGRVSRARASHATAPRVLSPARISFSLGRGWRRRVPGATRVTRAPCPSQVLCQQRWRGLTLPSSGCSATAVPARSVSPQRTPSPPP